jgi:hypothetical protein
LIAVKFPRHALGVDAVASEINDRIMRADLLPSATCLIRSLAYQLSQRSDCRAS